MKVLVGLGNPGEKYIHTRHNAGRELVDLIFHKKGESEDWVKERGIGLVQVGEVILVKSVDYFMNESGKIIVDLKKAKGEFDLYVIHDDLDIRLGEYKIQLGKGPEVHGGVNDIEKTLGKDFWRVRIGIDNRGVPRIPGEEYVLQKWLDEERPLVNEVYEKIFKEMFA